MPSEEDQAAVAGGEESLQRLPTSVVADVADGEDKYVEAFKQKMDEAVEGSMAKSKVHSTPLDKLLKTLQVPPPPPSPTECNHRCAEIARVRGRTDGAPEGWNPKTGQMECRARCWRKRSCTRPTGAPTRPSTTTF